MTADPAANRWQRRADRSARIGYWIVLITILIGLALGLIAAAAGGWWTSLGEGVGGLYGAPGATLVIAMLLGLPSLVLGFTAIVRRRWRGAVRMLAYFGPLAIAVAFVLVPHTLDPCFQGVLGPFSRLGDTPLCERFGLELNVHTRFHLLWHMAPTAVLVAGYRLALGRWHPAWGARHDRTTPRSQ
jgi:hypothetical protein